MMAMELMPMALIMVLMERIVEGRTLKVQSFAKPFRKPGPTTGAGPLARQGGVNWAPARRDIANAPTKGTPIR